MKERSSFKNVEVQVDLIEFDEEGIHYVYSPAFDLIGYGKTGEEARGSWQLILEEYFCYALNKNTLIEDLQNHGWALEKKKNYFTPPTLGWMLQNNEQMAEVYNKHNFTKTTQPIAVPLQTADA